MTCRKNILIFDLRPFSPALTRRAGRMSPLRGSKKTENVISAILHPALTRRAGRMSPLRGWEMDRKSVPYQYP
jgi:hypothetical protein